MATEVIGLKIGASRLVAARVSNNGGHSLTSVASHDLPPGLILRGELQSPEALSAELKDFFSANKLPKKRVRLGVASNRMGVRTIDIPGALSESELADAVTFRAQEDLPIPVMDAALDYEVIDERTTEDGEPVRRVLVAVAYRDLIYNLARAFEGAGIGLIGIDLEALALLRSLTPPSTTAQSAGTASSATVIVNVGSDHTVVAITDGRALEYARVIEWGGANVTEALAESLQLELEEAERIKRSLSDAPDELPNGLTQEFAGDARELVDGQVTAFAREFVSTLQYYQGQSDSLAISHVVLAGGGARLSALASGLEGLTGVPVRLGDPTVRLHSLPSDEAFVPGPELAVPIGLGLGQ
ncbi:MAG: type IV pilus assembly protein PilM [Thermoleophilia bacterium]|nr:type IV pilus assembly protein PilM [Thermoleophilia bacterium]MDH3725217.1 type IV pilus assembly protein PilM [Thermoleophilia bacterium]